MAPLNNKASFILREYYDTMNFYFYIRFFFFAILVFSKALWQARRLAHGHDLDF